MPVQGGMLLFLVQSVELTGYHILLWRPTLPGLVRPSELNLLHPSAAKLRGSVQCYVNILWLRDQSSKHLENGKKKKSNMETVPLLIRTREDKKKAPLSATFKCAFLFFIINARWLLFAQKMQS